jgi:DNA adenine methylase
MGGKARLARRLARLLPEHKCYVEVFAGAANLLFAKEPSDIEVLNDIDGRLVNLFRVVRCHPREFIAELALATHSRRQFTDYRKQPGLTDIQRAVRFWVILRTAFGGKGGTSHPDFGYGTTKKASLRRSAFAAIRRCHKRLDAVYIENLDFVDCIRRYDRPHTAFYLDPPYLDTAGFTAPFTHEDHQRLAAAVTTVKGKFLLSINDHAAIRRMYRGFASRKVPVKYSVSRDKTSKARSRTELLIANYPLPKQW